MQTTLLRDYEAFVAVAEAGSFVRGAIEIGVSASAMSQIIRRLEANVGVALIHRTTRSISLTDAGTLLLSRLRSAFAEIDIAAHELDNRREKPVGVVRLVTPRVAYMDHLEPMLPKFLLRYPEVTVDFLISDSFTEIAAGGFDFGVRLGEYLHPDTVAVPLGPQLRQIAVASPAYLALHGKPHEPRELLHHRCINWRQNEGGEIYAWQFAKDSVPLSVSVSGGLIYNDRETAVLAAIRGLGIALWVEHRLRPLIDARQLVPMLEDWSPPYPGFYLYYYRNRHMSAAAKVLLDAIRCASLNAC